MQAINANANYYSQKENISNYAIEQIENAESIKIMTVFYAPTVNHGIENRTEGKVEKVVGPLVITTGIACSAYALRFLVQLVKDIVTIFK